MTANHQAGASLIEMMVAVTIVAILTILAVPNYAAWLQNNRIRTAAESLVDGLNLARAEAVRRNTAVRFDLVSTLTSGCTLSGSPKAWVVARGNPSGACDRNAAAQTDTAVATAADPKIIQKANVADSAGSTVINAVNSASSGATSVVFDGTGRVSTASIATMVSRISLSNPAVAAEARPLDVRITVGGQVRLCDPNVTDRTDPRAC